MAEEEDQFLSAETGTDFDDGDEYEADGQCRRGASAHDAQPQYDRAEQQYTVGADEYELQRETDTTVQQMPEHQGGLHGEQSAENAEGQHFDRQTEGNRDDTREHFSGIASRNDVDDRKIFVGGLSWETTASDLREYFEKFGNVVDCTLKTDPSTGRSRGFGFVLFDSVDCVDKVIEEKSHVLHYKSIDPKRAIVRGSRGDACKKVFVGGVSPDMPESEIRECFGKYGKIEEIELPFDRMKNMRRAYVFISYESEEVVERVTAESRQTLGGKEVDVRKATPRSDAEGFARGRGGPGRHGRSRGRGAYAGQTTWGYYVDGLSTPAVPPAYNYNSYYTYGGYAYPDYGYPSYDYSSYYGQAAEWSSYQQSYAQSYPGGYYDYSSWYGQDQSVQSAAGKAKREGSGASYHPYSR